MNVNLMKWVSKKMKRLNAREGHDFLIQLRDTALKDRIENTSRMDAFINRCMLEKLKKLSEKLNINLNDDDTSLNRSIREHQNDIIMLFINKCANDNELDFDDIKRIIERYEETGLPYLSTDPWFTLKDKWGIETYYTRPLPRWGYSWDYPPKTNPFYGIFTNLSEVLNKPIEIVKSREVTLEEPSSDPCDAIGFEIKENLDIVFNVYVLNNELVEMREVFVIKKNLDSIIYNNLFSIIYNTNYGFNRSADNNQDMKEIKDMLFKGGVTW